MIRIINSKYSELIGAAFDIIPNAIADKLKYVHFFTGTDPIYAGLIHPDNEAMKRAGYNFKDVADVYRRGGSVAYVHNQTVEDKHTTVILPVLLPLDFPIHELGHVLDEILGWQHIAEPVTKYAETNRIEAFAEAFTSWLIPGYGSRPDDAKIYLFEEMAGL